jgi:hypothetical protein
MGVKGKRGCPGVLYSIRHLIEPTRRHFPDSGLQIFFSINIPQPHVCGALQMSPMVHQISDVTKYGSRSYAHASSPRAGRFSSINLSQVVRAGAIDTYYTV